jgi:hypothetical protein
MDGLGKGVYEYYIGQHRKVLCFIVIEEIHHSMLNHHILDLNNFSAGIVCSSCTFASTFHAPECNRSMSSKAPELHGSCQFVYSTSKHPGGRKRLSNFLRTQVPASNASTTERRRMRTTSVRTVAQNDKRNTPPTPHLLCIANRTAVASNLVN